MVNPEGPLYIYGNWVKGTLALVASVEMPSTLTIREKEPLVVS